MSFSDLDKIIRKMVKGNKIHWSDKTKAVATFVFNLMLLIGLYGGFIYVISLMTAFYK